MLDFYGLREQPFAATADPAYFYAPREYKECLFRIWTAVEGGHGPVIVLGRGGMGKTILLRKVLADMAADADRYETAVVASPSPAWTGFLLLETLLDRLHLAPERRSYDAWMEALNRYLLEDPDRLRILLVDDAQNIAKPSALEVLRLTQNLETPQRKLLNLVMFGQLEWAESLRAAPGLAGRASVVYVLPPFSLEDTRRMVEFRLRQAGAADGGPFFSEESVQLAHEYAEGVPGAVVTVCRNALAVAARLGQREIGKEIVLYTLEKTTLPNLDLDGDPTTPDPADLTEPEPGSSAVRPNSSRSRIPRALEEHANELLLRVARNRGLE